MILNNLIFSSIPGAPNAFTYFSALSYFNHRLFKSRRRAGAHEELHFQKQPSWALGLASVQTGFEPSRLPALGWRMTQPPVILSRYRCPKRTSNWLKETEEDTNKEANCRPMLDGKESYFNTLKLIPCKNKIKIWGSELAPSKNSWGGFTHYGQSVLWSSSTHF